MIAAKEKITQPVVQIKNSEKDVALLAKAEKKTNSVVKVEKDENLIDINEDTVDYKVDVVDSDDKINLLL